MDIVYKKGAINHADALSRRPDLKDSLRKLQLLRNCTNDEAECELHAQIFPLETGLHSDSGLHAEIKNAYDSDKYRLTRKSLPTWLVRKSNGLLYAYGTKRYVP
jgi:nitrite reductase/ring-hydroxylating ferredoxin subunit